MKLNINIRDRFHDNTDHNDMLLSNASVDVADLFELNGIPEEQEIDIHELLAGQHALALIWDADQVRTHYPHQTEDQAWAVLQECERRYTAEKGLTWEDIAETVAELYWVRESRREMLVTRWIELLRLASPREGSGVRLSEPTKNETVLSLI
jgi:hypothetical protein